ncbi:MAG TPA: hypothetical protein VG345_16530 [Bryobacteraceae bacterium]|nr:hypothetical protein [Bryobacteraceae bacterium]
MPYKHKTAAKPSPKQSKSPWKFDLLQERMNAAHYYFKTRLGIEATLKQQVAFATLQALSEIAESLALIPKAGTTEKRKCAPYLRTILNPFPEALDGPAAGHK